MIKKLSAPTVYLIYAGATSLLFSLVFTVSQIYRIETVNLNPLQLVLVGTVLEASCFLFEIPTGIVADMKSRRLSVIIGLNLIGIGFLLEGFVPVYLAVIMAQVLWGVGYTFLSGADEAWIADEVGETNLEKLYLKGAQVSQLTALAGIFISSVIGSILLRLPILIGGTLFIVLSIFLICFMPETGFHPIPSNEKQTWRRMGHTFYKGMESIKKRPILMVILSISLLYGLYSEGFDRLWNKHFLDNFAFPTIGNFKPVIWFGIINATAMVLSILAVEIIKRRMDKTGKLEKVWLLVMINILMTLGIIAFGASGNFNMALMTYLASYILRTTNGPLYRAWINQNITSGVRATVLSTFGQVDALGQVLGGPMIGYIALRFSVAKAIVIAGCILSPVILMYLYAVKRTKKVLVEQSISDNK